MSMRPYTLRVRPPSGGQWQELRPAYATREEAIGASFHYAGIGWEICISPKGKPTRAEADFARRSQAPLDIDPATKSSPRLIIYDDLSAISVQPEDDDQ